MLLLPASQITPIFPVATAAGALPTPRHVVPLQVRRLGRDGLAALTRHLLDLPPADRCTRFGGPTTDAAIRRHCATLDLAEVVCFAALDGDVVVGAALGFRCGVGSDGRGWPVEVAVSVAPGGRQRGLGLELAARVCAAAADEGATGAVFEFDARNAAIQGLIRRLGGQVAPFAEVCVVPLPTPYGAPGGQGSLCGAEVGGAALAGLRNAGPDGAAGCATA